MFLFQVLPDPSSIFGTGKNPSEKTPVILPTAPTPRATTDRAIEIGVQDSTLDKNPATTIRNELNKILKDPKNVGKTVVAYFWADNCPPCKDFTPKLEALVSSLDKDKTIYVKINLSKIYNDDNNESTISALRHVGEFSAIPLTLTYKPWTRDAEAIKNFDSRMAADEKAYQEKLAESKKRKGSLPPVKPAEVEPEPLSRSVSQRSGYVSGADDKALEKLLKSN